MSAIAVLEICGLATQILLSTFLLLIRIRLIYVLPIRVL